MYLSFAKLIVPFFLKKKEKKQLPFFFSSDYIMWLTNANRAFSAVVMLF
jgi:hypothetical protein